MPQRAPLRRNTAATFAASITYLPRWIKPRPHHDQGKSNWNSLTLELTSSRLEHGPCYSRAATFSLFSRDRREIVSVSAGRAAASSGFADTDRPRPVGPLPGDRASGRERSHATLWRRSGADVAGSPRLETLAASQLSEPMGSQARLDDLAVIITSGRTPAVPKGSWRTFAAYTAMVRGRARLIGANSSTARSPISRKFCSTRQ